MRHRASRPFLDLWHRLLRGATRPIGALARLSPLRAVAVAAVLLGVGTTTVVTVASVEDGATDQSPRAGAEERSTASTSRSATSRPQLDEQAPTSDGSDSSASSGGSEPGAGAPPRQEKAGSSKPAEPGVDLPDAAVTDGANAGATGEAADGTAGGPTDSPAPTNDPQTGSPSAQTSKSGSATPGSRSTSSAPSPRDLTAPNTAVTQKLPAGDTVRLAFSATEPASFACSLDGAAYVSCSSPVTYVDLRPGWHTLAVRATDRAGNVDPTPAEVRWHADAGPGTAD